jgi:hypothetical protein
MSVLEQFGLPALLISGYLSAITPIFSYILFIEKLISVAFNYRVHTKI